MYEIIGKTEEITPYHYVTFPLEYRSYPPDLLFRLLSLSALFIASNYDDVTKIEKEKKKNVVFQCCIGFSTIFILTITSTFIATIEKGIRQS